MIQHAWRAAGLVLLLAPSLALAEGAADSLAAGGAGAATYAPAAPAGGGNASIANPNISVIGWFEGVGGNDPALPSEPFQLREAELGFQSAVDPFTRADFFLSAGPEGLDLEEGYLTWLALPAGLQAKVGKFRADLGKFNRTHPPETPFADRPLAAEAWLGGEGLSTQGVSLSAIVPNPLGVYLDATANAGTAPDSSEGALWQPDRRGDLLVVGRTSAFLPLGDASDVNFGASYANALANPALRADGNRAQTGVLDVTLHWKNPRRSIYRSLLVQAEWLAERGSAETAETRSGAFAYAIWQFARQWKLGGRYDWTEFPDRGGDARGVLALVQYQPSEFSTVSVQARRVREADVDRDAAFFKWTFNIGPHGAHPY